MFKVDQFQIDKKPFYVDCNYAQYYRSFSKKNNKRFVIKRYTIYQNEDKQIEDEVQLQLMSAHKNVLKILGRSYYDYDCTYFSNAYVLILMEDFEFTLKHKLQILAPSEIQRINIAKKLISDILPALAHIEQLQITNHNISLESIYVTINQNRQQIYKLGNFRFSKNNISKQSTIKGSMKFRTPEQAIVEWPQRIYVDPQLVEDTVNQKEIYKNYNKIDSYMFGITIVDLLQSAKLKILNYLNIGVLLVKYTEIPSAILKFVLENCLQPARKNRLDFRQLNQTVSLMQYQTEYQPIHKLFSFQPQSPESRIDPKALENLLERVDEKQNSSENSRQPNLKYSHQSSSPYKNVEQVRSEQLVDIDDQNRLNIRLNSIKLPRINFAQLKIDYESKIRSDQNSENFSQSIRTYDCEVSDQKLTVGIVQFVNDNSQNQIIEFLTKLQNIQDKLKSIQKIYGYAYEKHRLYLFWRKFKYDLHNYNKYKRTQLSDDERLNLAETILMHIKQFHEASIPHKHINPFNIQIRDGKPLMLSIYFMDTLNAPYTIYSAPQSKINASRTSKNDYAKDIWSLGLVLLEIFYKIIIQQEVIGEVYRNKSNFKVSAMKTNVKFSFQASIADILQRCLFYNPAQRLSAKQLYQQIAEIRQQKNVKSPCPYLPSINSNKTIDEAKKTMSKTLKILDNPNKSIKMEGRGIATLSKK